MYSAYKLNKQGDNIQPWRTAAMKLKTLAPWKKSYDQPRQHIRKQRYYFTKKGLSSQSCIMSPFLFNLYVKYIMQNDGLDEEWAGIKIAGRNINNLGHNDDTPPLRQKVKN